MSRPVIWLIWDAAANWVVNRLVEEGRLPALKKLAEMGVRAAALPPFPNCQTPPSLATLFTGCWPAQHGIFGFNMPKIDSEDGMLSMTSGFEVRNLRAEPIWQTAKKQNCNVALVHIPWHDAQLVSNCGPCDFAIEAFRRQIAQGGIIKFSKAEIAKRKRKMIAIPSFELEIGVEGGRLYIEDLKSSTKGIIDESKFRDGDSRCSLELELGRGIVFQVLKWSRIDGLILWHSGVWDCAAIPDSELSNFYQKTGPFCGTAAGSSYRKGELGKRLIDGGDGEAEMLLMATVETTSDYFTRASGVALESFSDVDLSIHYQPCIDDIQHELIGWCDPRSLAYEKNYAEEAWEVIGQVYAMADKHLGLLMDEFSDDCTIVLSSDHGMVGVARNVYVNEVLSQAGLLEFDAVGNIDIGRTQILYHPANNGSLWVNDAEKRGGIVSRTAKDKLLEQARVTLAEIRDQINHSQVFKAIYPIDDAYHGPWDSALGDLFVIPEDGYNLRSDRNSQKCVIAKSHKSGSHITYSESPSIQGIFYACGDGLPAGKDLEIIDNRQLVSLICRQMQISPSGTGCQLADII